MLITICGGGALGHVCIGVLASNPDVQVNLLTTQPSQWRDEVSVLDCDGREYLGRISNVSSDAADVIPGADIVLLCLPGFAIQGVLAQIKGHLSPETIVGSVVCSTGFFFFAHELLGPEAKLFGFQRVPFIARTKEYGACASILGYKQSLVVAVENVLEPNGFAGLIQSLFHTTVALAHSFYDVSLSNSNPILHTSRLYSMWCDWNGEESDRCILFYKDWTVDAAQLLIDMDAEFISVLHSLPVSEFSAQPLLSYYESHDAMSLCRKLSSITAFVDLPAPMVKTKNGGWVPDFSSRYFQEDFPFGLRFVVEMAAKNGVDTPLLQKVYDWGMSVIAERTRG